METYFIVAALCLIGGFLAGFLTARNNQKYLQLNEDDLAKMGKDQLIKAKGKIEKFLSLLLVPAFLLGLSSVSFAAGTNALNSTYTKMQPGTTVTKSLYVLVVDLTADAADGSFLALDLGTIAGAPANIYGFSLVQVIVDHDATTKMSAGSSVTVTGAAGNDLLAGTGSRALTPLVTDVWQSPVYLDSLGGVAAPVPVTTLVVQFTQAAVAVNSAKARLTLIFTGK